MEDGQSSRSGRRKERFLMRGEMLISNTERSNHVSLERGTRCRDLTGGSVVGKPDVWRGEGSRFYTGTMGKAPGGYMWLSCYSASALGL